MQIPEVIHQVIQIFIKRSTKEITLAAGEASKNDYFDELFQFSFGGKAAEKMETFDRKAGFFRK